MGILRRCSEDLAAIHYGNHISIESFLPSSRKTNGVGASIRQERDVELSPCERFSRYPASHGRIGHHGESMQKERYGGPKDPALNDAKKLFEWVSGGKAEDEQVIPLAPRPRVSIICQPLQSQR